MLQIVDNKVYWVFETDAEPVFAPNIVLLDITNFTDAVKEGMYYNPKDNKFYGNETDIEPSAKQLYDNQTIIMNAIADLYLKINSLITVPGAPTAVTAIAKTASADLTWTAPVNNGVVPITDYKINVYSAGNFANTFDTKSIETTTTVTGLTTGTEYTFSVEAVNNAGNSITSVMSNAVTII